MKRDMKTAIRETLTKAIRQREWWMDHGYGEKTAARCAAISKIRSMLDIHQHSDTPGHLRLLLSLKSEIKEIIPSVGSRQRGLRENVLTLIDYAERKEALYV